MSKPNTISEEDGASLASFDVEERSSLGLRIATSAIDALFKFEPFFAFACEKARKKIIDRADMIGVGWADSVDEMKRNMDALQAEYDGLLDNQVWESTPEYYKAPFHAYPEGNLCWKAAMEVEPSALSVHANIFTDKGEFEANGDDHLRSNFHRRMREMMAVKEPMDIVDIGCSTGLSTLKLAETFNQAKTITGVDLSPHMLSVARHNLRTREEQAYARGRVSYIHAPGEKTGLEEGSADLVSLCLTSHELPAEATREVFREAYRLLRPGGAISFMDMNPLSLAFQRLAGNPFAFAGFKSTEPYLQEYIALDLGHELQEAGFMTPEVRPNSPRHRTCVAYVAK
ncbi:unnamed protein product [Discosporangium mesarthrocarpum]